MEELYVTYDMFVPERVISETPIPKRFEDRQYPNTPPVNYYNIPLQYKYPNTETEISLKDSFIDDFVLEGCEMESNFGITKRTKSNGSDMYVLSAYIDRQSGFTGVCEEIFEVCNCIVKTNKKYISKTELNNKPIIEHFYDNMTGEKLLNKPYKINLKLVNGDNKTIFTDLNDQEVSWELLTNVRIRFIPLIRFKYINIVKCNVTIQYEMVRAIITSIKPKDKIYSQKSTINSLREKYINLASKVDDQIKYLITRKQSNYNTKEIKNNQSTVEATNEATDDFISIETALIK